MYCCVPGSWVHTHKRGATSDRLQHSAIVPADVDRAGASAGGAGAAAASASLV